MRYLNRYTAVVLSLINLVICLLLLANYKLCLVTTYFPIDVLRSFCDLIREFAVLPCLQPVRVDRSGIALKPRCTDLFACCCAQICDCDSLLSCDSPLVTFHICNCNCIASYALFGVLFVLFPCDYALLGLVLRMRTWNLPVDI